MAARNVSLILRFIFILWLKVWANSFGYNKIRREVGIAKRDFFTPYLSPYIKFIWLTSENLEVFRLFLYFGIDLVDELLDGHRGLLAAALLAHRHKALGLFFLANDYHIRNALQLVVANLAAQFLITQVDRATHTLKVELLEHLLGIVVILLRQRQDGHLGK